MKIRLTAILIICLLLAAALLGCDLNIDDGDKDGAYTVVFLADGEEYSRQTVEYGKAAVAPSNPTKETDETNIYRFKEWDRAFDNVTEDLTVNAVFDSYPIYKSDKGVIIGLTNEGKELKTLRIPQVLDGYTVTEIGELAFSADGEVTEITLPKTIVSIGRYAFYECGALVTVTLNSEEPPYIGYGIFDKCDSLENILVPTGSIAGYKQAFEWQAYIFYMKAGSYTVTFISDGEVYDVQTVAFGKAAVAPSEPVKAKNAQYTYAFGGWDKLFNNVRDDLTVYAEFTETVNVYGVMFYAEGLLYLEKEYEYGQKIEKPEAVDGNRSIENWYVNSDCTELWDFENAVTGSLNLYSKWHITQSDGFTLNDGIITAVSESLRQADALTVPERIDGKEVTGIGSYALENCMFRTLFLPSGLKIIKNNAFNKCVNLETLNIPESVTEIGANAFMFCSKLKDIKLPFLNTYLGYYFGAADWQGNSGYVPNSLINITIKSGEGIPTNAFRNLNGVKSVTLPETLKNIGAGAFADCSALSEITVPKNVLEIGASAFLRCAKLGEVKLENGTKLSAIGSNAFEETGLTEFTLPKGVVSLGYCVFFNCKKLTAVNADAANTEYKSEDGALFSKDGGRLIIYPSGKTGASFAFPSGVSEVVDYAFYAVSALTDISFNEGLIKIGTGAFEGCGLKKISVPVSVSEIGFAAFKNCAAVTDIEIPFTGASKTSTDRYFGFIFGALSVVSNAAAVPASLKNVVITDEAEIVNRAFFGCQYIEKIELNGEISKIGERAFYGCAGLLSLTVLSDEPPVLGALAIPEGTEIFVKDAEIYKNAPVWSVHIDNIYNI